MSKYGYPDSDAISGYKFQNTSLLPSEIIMWKTEVILVWYVQSSLDSLITGNWL